MMSVKYATALYEFCTSEAGEIPFSPFDIIQVTGQIDDNWLSGTLLHNGMSGSFPANFVQPLSLPSLLPHQKAFVAHKPFDTNVDGDLIFSKGQLIIAERQVDSNWWYGTCGDLQGIFPVTHVAELQAEFTEPTCANSAIEKVESPLALDQIALGRANMHLTAQLDNELNFSCGDFVHIIKTLEDGFALGRSGDRTGSFPLIFVDIIEGSVETKKPVLQKQDSKFGWWKEGGDNNNVNMGDAYFQVTEGAEKEVKHHRNSSYTSDNTRSHDSEVTPYGKTLFPFYAENDNELTFDGNEIVTLVCHVDEQWTEGELDGQRGIFPRSYVEIIVDCESKVSEEESQESKGEEEQLYGRVMYDFQAVSDRDLNLAEGDTVTILSQADDHWVEAQHDDGRTGLVPMSYVELISEPLLPPSPQVAPPAAETPTEEVAVMPTNGQMEKQEDPSTVATEQAVVEAEVEKVKPKLKPKPQLKPKPKVKLKLESATSEPDAPNEPPLIEIVPPEVNEVPPEVNEVPPEVNEVPPEVNTVEVIVPFVEVTLATPESQTDDTDGLLTKKNAVTPVTRDPPAVPILKRQDSGKSAPARPKQRPAQRLSTTSLDEIIANEIKQASSANGVAKQPIPVVITKPQKKPSLNELRAQKVVGQSTFYTPESRSTPHRPPLPCPSKAVHFPVTFDDNVDEVLKPSPPPRPCEPQRQRPVPHRKAPPRPTGKAVPKPRPKDALIDFSPEEQSLVCSQVSEENAAVVADLDRRLKEIDDDLKKYKESCRELNDDLCNSSGIEAKVTIQETMYFYLDNIEGLSKERDQIKECIYELQPSRAAADLAAKEHEDRQKEKAEEEKRQKEEREREREAMIKKRKETRQRVISEMLSTEKNFLWSLNLFVDFFVSQRNEKCPLSDDLMDTLCGNMDEVMDVSQRLLSELESATAGKDFDQQLIGPCFLQLKEEMKQVYAPYCRNHDDVIAILEKVEDNPEVQDFFNRMLDNMRQQGTVFDLGSLLIKPVQRILKYPLLLNELIKSTEDSHDDKPHLLEAVNAMTDVAATINEFKRRKDLVMRYKKDRESSLSDRFAKLNVHSTMKKFYRLSQKVSGINTIDEDFNREERRFRALDHGVKSLVRDISAYIEQMQNCVAGQELLANDIADFYGDKDRSQVEQFCQVHNTVAATLLEQFKSSIESCVIVPLNRLQLMFQGPTKVIKKRHDKLLDFDNLNARIKGLRETEQAAAKQDLQMAKANYEALNAQLMDDMPKLYVLSMDILNDCLNRFLRAEEKFHHAALDQMYQLMQLDLVLSSHGSSSSIVEPFNIAHTAAAERLTAINIVKRAFLPQTEERRKSKGARKSTDSQKPQTPENDVQSDQSDSQRAYLREKYATEKLFVAPSAVAPSGQLMDLRLAEGTLVGIIKEGDPMGNQDRWFVDTGASRGFVLKNHFLPASPRSQTSSRNSSICSPGVSSLMEFSPEKDSPPPDYASVQHLSPSASPNPSSQSPAPVQRKQSQSSPLLPCLPSDFLEEDLDEGELPTEKELGELYQAIYPFKARNDLELTIAEGDVVFVIQEHDQDGNPDWWMVELHGKKGYVPAAYIFKVQ